MIFGVKEKGGRNRGLIAAPRRGALVKRVYRFLDTKRTLFSERGFKIIYPYMYDPNRTGHISLIMHPDGVLTYILAAEYYTEQKKIYNLMRAPGIHDKGWSDFIENIPSGTIIYNVEMVPGLGSKIVRSAGNSAVLLRKDEKLGNFAVIKLKSGEHRLINKKAIASVGVVSNHEHFLRDLGKAGTRRLFGFRPRVRPSAMNPVDHPMGGRTKGGCAPCDRKRFLSRGPSTVKQNKNKFIFVAARKARKQRIS
jgi:large subunit ribosomal protein L2